MVLHGSGSLNQGDRRRIVLNSIGDTPTAPLRQRMPSSRFLFSGNPRVALVELLLRRIFTGNRPHRTIPCVVHILHPALCRLILAACAQPD